jgi:putative ABC transport system ATP-binding protein
MIKTENLTKTYNLGDNSVNALKNCNVTVNDGEMIAITGASGSGKTTLLHLLGGLDNATSGKVLYDGENILAMNDEKLSDFRRKNIGFVFQSFRLLAELNVKENIILPLLLDNKKVDNSKVEKIAKELGLNERLKHLPTQLSGGQQQRTAIARALINEPKILLCDEPTGNLDKKTGDNVLELLLKLNQNTHQTIVIVTHNSEIANQCSRIINIIDGEIES